MPAIRNPAHPGARARSLRLVDIARRIAALRAPRPRPDAPDAIPADKPPQPLPLVGGAAASID